MTSQDHTTKQGAETQGRAGDLGLLVPSFIPPVWIQMAGIGSRVLGV